MAEAHSTLRLLDLVRATLCIVALWAAAPCSAQGADTRYVNIAAPAGGNGTSWATAFNNIKSAVSAANANQNIKQIWVAKGSYFPGTTPFTLKNNFVLYGGFAGTETALGQRNIALNETILTGQPDRDRRRLHDPRRLRCR